MQCTASIYFAGRYFSGVMVDLKKLMAIFAGNERIQDYWSDKIKYSYICANPPDIPAFHGGLKKPYKDTFASDCWCCSHHYKKLLVQRTLLYITAEVNWRTTGVQLAYLLVKQWSSEWNTWSNYDIYKLFLMMVSSTKKSLRNKITVLCFLNQNCKCLYMPVPHCSFLI